MEAVRCMIEGEDSGTEEEGWTVAAEEEDAWMAEEDAEEDVVDALRFSHRLPIRAGGLLI